MGSARNETWVVDYQYWEQSRQERTLRLPDFNAFTDILMDTSIDTPIQAPIDLSTDTPTYKQILSLSHFYSMPSF